MLNFTNMLSAPEVSRPPVFVATYSDGFGLKRKEIEAPTRLAAYAIATGRPPLGHTLTQLRKKKGSGKEVVSIDMADSVDVKLTRALAGIYANTDLACRFAANELHDMARRAMA